jgi:uncharacterized repeat protein (TIGR02543 family)
LWAADTLNITYDSQSGTAVDPGTILTGGTIAEEPVSTRAGYTFLGWSRSIGSDVVSFASPGYSPTDTSGFTLYAEWSANPLEITYNSNGGSVVSVGSTTTGSSISAPTEPIRAGYTFAGWFAESDLSGYEIEFPYTHGQTEDFDLYAKWTANSNTVTYDSQSGSAVDPGSFVTAGTIASAPVSTRAGYTLLGWSRDIGGTVVSFESPGYSPTDTSGFTLYAIWSANPLTVTYESNGGSVVSQTSTTTATPVSSEPTEPTRAGYTFLGWFDNVGLSGTEIEFPYTHGQTDHFTVYAKWTANTLDVTF